MNYGAQTLFFPSTSGSQAIMATESGFTNTPFNGQFDVTLTGCSGIAIARPTATGASIVASGSVGMCSGRLTEHGTGYPLTNHTANVAGSETHDGTFYIEVTTASASVSGRHK